MSSLLRLQPANNLEFNWSSTGKKSETILRLENTSDGIVAFKVKTTQPKRYCVKPNSGAISAKETQEVVIAFQPQKEDNVAKMPEDKFLVQSVAVKAKDEDPQWSSNKSVTGQKLKCAFKRTPELESVRESPSDKSGATPSFGSAVTSQPVDTSVSSQKSAPSSAAPSDGSNAELERMTKLVQQLTAERDRLRNSHNEATRALHKNATANVTNKEIVSSGAPPVQSRVNLIWLLLIALIAFFLGRTV